jgi:hypothetical protein
MMFNNNNNNNSNNIHNNNNRSLARKLLRDKVDLLLNGDKSKIGRRISKIQRRKGKAARYLYYRYLLSLLQLLNAKTKTR